MNEYLKCCVSNRNFEAPLIFLLTGAATILSTCILYCYVVPRHLPSEKKKSFAHVAEENKDLENCIEKSKQCLCLCSLKVHRLLRNQATRGEGSSSPVLGHTLTRAAENFILKVKVID